MMPLAVKAAQCHMPMPGRRWTNAYDANAKVQQPNANDPNAW